MGEQFPLASEDDPIEPVIIRLPKEELDKIKKVSLHSLNLQCDFRAHHAALDAAIGPRTRGVVAIDFDDTLTKTGGIDALISLRSSGWGLVIFSANADVEGIYSWLKARWPDDAGPIPPATNHKPQATWFVDDKAISFTSWDDVLEILEVAE